MSQSRSIERPLIILTHLIIMKIVQSTHGCVLVITVERAHDKTAYAIATRCNPS